MNGITDIHIFVWCATPTKQCAHQLSHSYLHEMTKINFQFLINVLIMVPVNTHGFSEVLNSNKELTEGIVLGRPPNPSSLFSSDLFFLSPK